MVWSSHNFAQATTAQLLLHMQLCDLIQYLELDLGKNNYYKFSLGSGDHTDLL